jgi:maltose/maltodextrin transport system permease protein
MNRRAPFIKWLLWLFASALMVASVTLVYRVHSNGHTAWAVGMFALLALGFYVYLSHTQIAYRYLFPGVAGMLVFIAFPLLYTVQIGFTNYSSSNLLGFDRAKAYLLEQSVPDDTQMMRFSLHREGQDIRLALSNASATDGKAYAREQVTYLSEPLKLSTAPQTLKVLPLPKEARLDEPLPLSEHLMRRDTLLNTQLRMPDASVLSYVGVRDFGTLTPLWQPQADGSLKRTLTGETFTPNHQTGFFENAQQDRLQPGYTVGVGFDNYIRMFSDPDFRGPFISIFVWTLIFALLTVFFTLAIGASLAVVLNWESLEYRTLYRTLLFLPYAVPGFISILVFKGLFNQNFGEINAILNAVFGVKPAWFADPLLAKVMILIVNTWLGYPYIMVLCTGLIKSIPADLYEASAIAGAGPLTNFFKITMPLLVKPLMPLLVSVFAFNFNNFVLIALLTDGRPDFLNTKVPAGTNDILVSYTYRIAFQDSGQNFGLAAAISTVLFFMVAVLSLVNLRLSRAEKEGK